MTSDKCQESERKAGGVPDGLHAALLVARDRGLQGERGEAVDALAACQIVSFTTGDLHERQVMRLRG